MTNEELALKLEEMRQSGETARQTARIAFYGVVLNTLLTAFTTVFVPLYMRSNHIETTERIDSAKTAVEAKVASVEDKADVIAKSWKAYTTKEPSDIIEANAALIKADKPHN